MAAAPIELVRDPNFSNGFSLLAAEHGRGAIGEIRFAGATAKPVWQVAQWNSRFALRGILAPPPPALCVSNVAKSLGVEPTLGGGPVLTLRVDSRPEYEAHLRQSAGEPWVHLLVQQEIQGAPPLADLASLRLRFAVRMQEAKTFRPTGYSPSLHAAQFQVVLTLNNTQHDSAGFGDYLWFVVPVFDDRYPVPPPYVAPDFAMTQGKLIYNPGGDAIGLKPVKRGEWQPVTCELRPWLERALNTAWAKGYLNGSTNLAHYTVAHLNLGWEVPGLNCVSMDLRDLSLEAARLPLHSEPTPQ